jgi:FkbM family methyltransferase
MKDLIKSFTPDKYRYAITHFKKKFSIKGFSEQTYSGDGEDRLLLKTLFKNEQDGYYVDVGCFHPKYISNTYLLHKQGWSGINIDPNKEAVDLFKKYRPRDINIQLGVAGENTHKKYYGMIHAGTNTFNNDHADAKLKKSGNSLIGIKSIKCETLAQILEKNLPKGQKIDVLDVDVERMDLEVLKSNDWELYPAKVILVEDILFRTEMESSETYLYLKSKGYSFHSYMNITLVMKREDLF